MDVEPVRIGKLTFVPVGGQQPRRDDHIRRDDLPAELGLDRGHPADLSERGAVAQHLLDGGLDQRAVRLQLRPYLWVLIQAQHGVAEQRGGSDVSRDQQHDGEVHHLLVGQPLTVGLHGGKPADQISAWVGPPVGAVLVQVGDHVGGALVDLPGELGVIRVGHVAGEEAVRPGPE
jgi:hypothetical protein